MPVLQIEDQSRENIEDAAYVFWSKEIDIYQPEDFSKETIENIIFADQEIYVRLNDFLKVEHSLRTPGNPESFLLEKESLSTSLTKECLLMAKTILNMPEEMFLINGKMKKMALRKAIRKETGWSKAKIAQVHQTLIHQLLDITEQQYLQHQNY
jgi:hypothetical protein